MFGVDRLVLEWNALGMWDEAFSLFCEGLSANGTVTQLDLRNDQITHQGASELGMVLRRNSALEVLGEPKDYTFRENTKILIQLYFSFFDRFV